MIALFKTNHPAVLLYLLLYTLLLKGAYLFLPAWIAPSPDSLLSLPVTVLLTKFQVSGLTVQIIDMAMVYLQAILLNTMLVNFGLFDRNTYLPALFYITASSLLGLWSAADLQTIAHFFLLFSMYNLYSLSGKEISRENIFYTAMYLSIGSLFYFPVSLFLPVILGTLIVRGYKLTEVILSLIGFLLPYYFIGLGFYYYNDFSQFNIFMEKLIYERPGFSFGMRLSEALWLAYLLLLSVFGFMRFMSDGDFKIIRQRRMLFIAAAFMLLVLLCTPFASGTALVYLQLLVPVSAVFLPKIFERRRLRFYHHILFYLLFLGALGFELYYLHII